MEIWRLFFRAWLSAWTPIATLMSASCQDILAALDAGTPDCAFTKLMVEWKRKNKKPDDYPWEFIDFFLPFCKSNTNHGREANLQALLNSVNEISVDRMNELTCDAVCTWIFHTNKLEFASTPTESDTKLYLQGKLPETSEGALEVKQTFALLQKSYPGYKKSWSDYGWDQHTLLEWHSILMTGIVENESIDVGQFRTYGVAAMNLDSSIHQFPHHKILKAVVAKLTTTTSWPN